MAYELEQLLIIRNRREDRARGELQIARQAVRKAETELQEQKDVLAEYERTKEERRNRIFDLIIGHEVKREDLELAREGIARIDEEGVLKADNVVRAEHVVEKKKEEEAAAKVAYIITAKEQTKIIEHKAEWTKEELKISEYRQDIELEDFTGKKVNDELGN